MTPTQGSNKSKNSSFRGINLCTVEVRISGIHGFFLHDNLRFSPYFPQNRFRVHFSMD